MPERDDRCRRHVAKVDSIQGRNVDAKLHRRSAEEGGEERIGLAVLVQGSDVFGVGEVFPVGLLIPEARLAPKAEQLGHLSGVFPALEAQEARFSGTQAFGGGSGRS